MQKIKTFSLILGVLIMSLVVGYLVFAVWTEPGALPPASNVPAPVNIGPTQQWKEGGFGVGTRTFDLTPGHLAASRFIDREGFAWFIDPSSTGIAGLFRGNVGIGTAGPRANLNTLRGIAIGDGHGVGTIHGDRRSLQFLTDTAYGGIHNLHSGFLMYSTMPGGWGTGQLHFAVGTDWGVYDTGSPTMTLAGRNVGIGTTAPGARLHVFGTTGDANAGLIILDAGAGAGGHPQLRMGVNNVAGRSWIQSHGLLPLFINELGNNVILNSGGGNVGIGTTGPGQRLTVSAPSGTRVASFDDGAGPCCAPYYTVSINEGYGANQPTLQFHDAGVSEGQIILQGDIGGGQRGFRFQSVQTSMGGRFTGNLLVDGNVGIGTTAPGRRLDVRGDVIANAYFHHSDRALKAEITPLENSLARILNLRPVSFKWRENNEKTLGLIAQDIETVFPEVVSKEGESGSKSVNYSALIAPLIQAIQEQQKEIDELREEVKRLTIDN